MLHSSLSTTPYAVVLHTNMMVRPSDLFYIKKHKKFRKLKFLIMVLPYIRGFICVKISGMLYSDLFGNGYLALKVRICCSIDVK